MLLWALWLASSMLRWVKWAWACFSEGGYWPPRGGAGASVAAQAQAANGSQAGTSSDFPE
jgi:hypothetical protein